MALVAVGAACQLTRYVDERPCHPGQVELRACGPCGGGYQARTCLAPFEWEPYGECTDNVFDVDGDGRGNELCLVGGVVEDCDDSDPRRWTGMDDLDRDGHIHARCGGDDCHDELPDEVGGDLDGDGFVAVACCEPPDECDCLDGDPWRWTGNADLDGDGHVHEGCGGDDCDDDDPLRWTGHADLDGDGFDSPSCGGNDCDDDDPVRWPGHADLDGDGFDAATCGGDDCDDGDPNRFRLADPVCGHALDEDCDGVIDELSGCDACVSSAPRIVRSFPETGVSRSVFAMPRREGFVAFVAAEAGLYRVMDDGETDEVSGPFDTGDSHGLFVVGGPILRDEPTYVDVYVASDRGLYVVDWSDDGPSLVSGPMPIGALRDVFFYGELAYAAGQRGLYVVDISEPWDPWVLSSVVVENVTEDSRRIHMEDRCALVATRNGLYSVDASHPESARLAWAEYGRWDVFPSDPTRGDVALVTTGAPPGRTDVLLASVTAEGGVGYRGPVPNEEDWCPPPITYVEDAAGLFAVPQPDQTILVFQARPEGLLITSLDPDPESGGMTTLAGPLDVGAASDVFVTGSRAFVTSESGLHVVHLGCDG